MACLWMKVVPVPQIAKLRIAPRPLHLADAQSRDSASRVQKRHLFRSSKQQDAAAMEVEVKLTLADQNAHQKLCEILVPYHKITHLQENFFFDGINGELSARRAVLRLRFYNVNARCVASLKSQAVLENGVSRVEEVEEDLDAAIGRECVENSDKLGFVENGIVKKAMADHGCSQFVCLGGFRNVRNVFEWEGEQLEVDETQYAFGTAYEVECESPDPDRVKAMLEAFLGENGILYSHSVASKFAVFRSGKLPV